MVIKCSFSVPLKAIDEYNRQARNLPPLPGHITKRGPYIDDSQGKSSRITTVYEFKKSLLAEAWDNISKHIDALRRVPGFKLSAQVMDSEDTPGKDKNGALNRPELGPIASGFPF